VGIVTESFFQLFTQTLVKLTNLETLVVRLWELSPRSCKRLLEKCPFRLNAFSSSFIDDQHLSSFLSQQTDIQLLSLTQTVSPTFNLPDSALPNLCGLGLDKDAKLALSIAKTCPVVYLRAGGYDRNCPDTWLGLASSAESIKGLIVPHVNIESLHTLAGLCPNLEYFSIMNFRVVSVSGRVPSISP
jgi:hypothetical protein